MYDAGLRQFLMSQFPMGQFSRWKRTARELLGVAAGLRVSGTEPRSTAGLRGRRRVGDILAAVAVSSRGLGRSPLKAQTRVRIPLPLCLPCPPPSSNGQDTTLSRWEQGFDSPWGHGGGRRLSGRVLALGAPRDDFSARAPIAQLAEQLTLNQ